MTALRNHIPPEISAPGKHGHTKQQPKMPVWTGPDYPRIAPGRYSATAVRIIEPQYIRRWQRYSLGVCFRPFSEPEAEVVLFLNLDVDMNPKRGGEYYRSWMLANGEAPTKGQTMDADVFLEGQIYEIEVIDAELDSEGKPKCDAEVYSKVKRIISVIRNGEAPSGIVPFTRK